MKKIVLSSIISAGILFAGVGNNANIYNFPIPLQKKYLSLDNGGAMSTAQAYRDGVGIFTSAEFGNIDNGALNNLVFKYGEEAAAANSTVKDYILNGNFTDEEKKLANNIAIFDPNADTSGNNLLNGTSCNDGNAKTINDIYVNGICIGTNVEGQTCNDNNAQTINDKYVDGVCVGTNVEGQTCNDGNVQTINDVYHNGICTGTNVQGQSCDDGNSNTINDKYYNGVCSGIPVVVTGNTCSTGYSGAISGNVMCTNNTDPLYGLFNQELATGWNNFVSSTGIFYLYDTTITNVDNLSNFTTAPWVQFEDNTLLTSLAGLTNFTSTGRLEIFGNLELTSFNGLQSLNHITDFLHFSANSKLSDISALSGVTSVGPDFYLYFELPDLGYYSNKISGTSALCAQPNNTSYYSMDKRLICEGHDSEEFTNLMSNQAT